jgi:hypothetical protein
LLGSAILPYLPAVAIRDFFNKLGRPPEVVRGENLCRWVESLHDVGVTPIEEVVPRRPAKVAGVIQNIRIEPREGTGSIEATIIDGTGEVLVRWLGRSSLPGIQLGMGLIVEGTPGETKDGYLTVMNPDFSLVPGPEHG